MIAKYYYGWTEYNPREYFKAGARLVLAPLLANPDHEIDDDVLTTLYKHGRSTLYHEGFLDEGLGITSKVRTVDVSGVDVALPIWWEPAFGKGILWINPQVLIDWMQRYFSSYLARLMNPDESELRAKFHTRITNDGGG